MPWTKICLIICGFTLFVQCLRKNTHQAEENASSNSFAKFEPPDGKCLVFIGQELEANGGLDSPYHQGYLDFIDKPAGFTMYTGISPGDTSFGRKMIGLDGIWETADWGDGASNMNLQLTDPDFSGMALAIGFWMLNNEEKIAQGVHDGLLNQLVVFFKSIYPRPVFLRIGYEFMGEWNGYDRKNYLAAFRYIKDYLDNNGVNNVATVWQSHGWDEPLDSLALWYPGDQYVDWCAYSFFNRWNEANMIEFARSHQKPVFIAEASPKLPSETVQIDNVSKPTILSNEASCSRGLGNLV